MLYVYLQNQILDERVHKNNVQYPNIFVGTVYIVKKVLDISSYFIRMSIK